MLQCFKEFGVVNLHLFPALLTLSPCVGRHSGRIADDPRVNPPDLNDPILSPAFKIQAAGHLHRVVPAIPVTIATPTTSN